MAYAAVYEELERFKLSAEPYVPQTPQVMAMVAMYAVVRSRDPIGAAVFHEACKQVERTIRQGGLWGDWSGDDALATLARLRPMSERVKRIGRASAIAVRRAAAACRALRTIAGSSGSSVD